MTASGRQGRLIPQDHRVLICEQIDVAVKAGARLTPASDAIGIHPRTYRRWKEDPIERRLGSRKSNSRALSEQERQYIIEVCTSEKYRDIAPPEILARLAEEGVYIASTRTFYRVLRSAGLLNHRGNSRPARTPYSSPELMATGLDQVYTWEIIWMPTTVRGIFLYCYAIIDVWS